MIKNIVYYVAILIIFAYIAKAQNDFNCLNALTIDDYYVRDDLKERNDVYAYIGLSLSNIFDPKPGTSIGLYDVEGQIIKCANYTRIFEISTVPTLGFSFDVTYYQDNVLVVKSQRDETVILPVYFNNFDFFFMDLDFNPIPGMPPLAVNTSHPAFFPNATVYPLGVVFLDEKQALVLLNEGARVDIKEYNATADRPNYTIYTTSFVIANRQTSEILHAISGFYTFMNLDYWTFWLGDDNRRSLRSDSTNFTEMVHISSIDQVKGEHWHESLKGQRTFVVSSHHLDSIDLFTWDFESGGGITFLWRFPHISSPKALENWRSKWEIVGDPLNGLSHAHDVNVYYEKKGHFLAHDNGDNHNYVNNRNKKFCPMSRAVEYKIEMKKDPEHKFKATLVWSYPLIKDYPPISTPHNPDARIGRVRDQERICDDFWYYFPYQFFGGSVRRIEGTALIQYSRFSIDAVINGREFPDYKYDTQMNIVVDQLTGQEVLYWNSTTGGLSAFKLTSITPVNAFIPS